MEVIAITDRTIDGIARKAGERFELPDGTDLVEKGIVRDLNAPVIAQPETPERPIGWVGRVKAETSFLSDENAIAADRPSLATSKSTAKRRPLA